MLAEIKEADAEAYKAAAMWHLCLGRFASRRWLRAGKGGQRLLADCAGEERLQPAELLRRHRAYRQPPSFAVFHDDAAIESERQARFECGRNVSF